MTQKRVGVNIKRLREAKGITQTVLAKRAKLHRVSLAKIEAEMMLPRLTTLERLAKALGVPVGELLK
jgi:XRE family transcriptional regulator, regulator of sulfur utilization